MTKNRTDLSQFVWAKLILLAGAIVVSGSFVYLTWWSFGETKEWFGFLDFGGGNYVSLSLAFVFQYGQGPVLYLRARLMSRYKKLDATIKQMSVSQHASSRAVDYKSEADLVWWGGLILVISFIVFASVDAWTNIQQMWIRLGIAGVGADKYILTAVIGIVLVFIEEGLGIMISMAGNLVNDIRQVYGYERIVWLDMFGKLAEEGLSGKYKDNDDWKPMGSGYRSFDPPKYSNDPSRKTAIQQSFHSLNNGERNKG